MMHIPVLLAEVIEQLRPQPNESFVDGTVGQGGHAYAILERIKPGGRLLAIDRDRENLETARTRLAIFGNRVVFAHDRYVHTQRIAYDTGFHSVDGILLDLGFSSYHVKGSGRGFSFLGDEPLDMRYDVRSGVTAAELVNESSKEELARIFRTYGEEPRAAQIAEQIVKARKREQITSSAQLAHLVGEVIPQRGKIHPATRVFQALRIAVNDELGELERALPDLVSLLAPEGRLAIISFHSLEDRIVKRFFKQEDGKTLAIITKRPIAPSRTEINTNKKSRSAKLRVAQKLCPPLPKPR